MRGELDDALARLRRWNEVRQRLAGEPVEDLPEPAGPFVPAAATPPPPVPVASPHPSAPPSLPSAPTSPAPVPHHAAQQGDAPASRQQEAARQELLPPRPVGAVPPQQFTREGDARPPAAVPGPAMRGPVLPRVVEDSVAAVAEVVRRYPGAMIMITVEDAGAAWTAQVIGDNEGRATVSRLESRAVSANGGAQSPQWPGNTGRSAEAIQPMPVPRPVVLSRPDDAPERTASRLAELVRRDPSLLEPPGETIR